VAERVSMEGQFSCQGFDLMIELACRGSYWARLQNLVLKLARAEKCAFTSDSERHCQVCRQLSGTG